MKKKMQSILMNNGKEKNEKKKDTHLHILNINAVCLKRSKSNLITLLYEDQCEW